MVDWWNQSYPFRRKILIETEIPLFPGHPITLYISSSFLENKKVRTDFADIVITHVASNGAITVVPRSVIQNSWGIRIAFDTVVSESDVFYLYYGNPDLNNAPLVASYNEDLWPVSVTPASGGISFTNPGKHWVNGVSAFNSARATFRFSGERVRVVSDTGHDKGKFLIKLENVSQGLFDLAEFSEQEDAIIYQNDSLSHTILLNALNLISPVELQLVVQGNQSVNIQRIDYSIAMLVTISLEEVTDTLTWTTYSGSI